MLIGSHIHMTKPDYLLGAVKEAHQYDENTMMIYTGSPHNTERAPIDDMKIAEAQKEMEKDNIAPLLTHAPHIINLANGERKETYHFDIHVIQEEMERTKAMNASQLCMHPGEYVNQSKKTGIKNIVSALNKVLTTNSGPSISLVNTAGEGTEIGSRFEDLADILSGVTYNDRLSITLNTAHLFNAGYDIVHHFDEVLTEFDKIIGLNRVKVVALVDSKTPFDSHKDRHDNIGFGQIGFDALHRVATFDKWDDVPKILVTPYVNRHTPEAKAPFKYEIQSLKSGQFHPEWRQKLEVKTK